MTDPSRGPVTDGEGMWRMDSVQLAIDTSGAATKGGRVNNFHELGFAPKQDGRVSVYAWSGAADTNLIRSRAVWTDAGYRLEVAIPWSVLSLDPENLPADIGVNVVINDGGPPGAKRRAVEWTPGSMRVKDRSVFARVAFPPDGALAGANLHVMAASYDDQAAMRLRYIEHARVDQPAKTLRVKVVDPLGKPMPGIWKDVSMEPLQAGSTRMLWLEAPASVLPAEGDYAVTASSMTPGGEVRAVIKRFDIASKIARSLADCERSYAETRKLAASVPGSADDAALAIAGRFLARVSDPAVSRKQTPEWTLLQLEEVDGMLASARERFSGGRGLNLPRPDFDYRAPSGTPGFAYGFGHFDKVVQDLPFLSKIGAKLIQRERGPRDLQEDGTLPAKAVEDTLAMLDRAEANGVKVDLIVSPHLFPDWALEKEPSLKIEGGGFMKFNIQAPYARQLLETWLRAFLPRIKGHPALNSLCLTNEPTWLNSGREEFSRPDWTAYLSKRHRDIAALNALYGTSYRAFSEVPVPPTPAEPEAIGQRRAYYDWIRFSHQNFADWHRWYNGLVKELVPELPTHAKIMMDFVSPDTLPRWAEPESICDITDIAGNDGYAWPGAWGGYAYNWLYVSMWYDLLHSFRGQPVFNSENHLILDNSPAEHIAPAHTRAVLWQGALHHQAFTTTWVWDEGSVPDLKGSIYFRPANIEAASRAMRDLERLGDPVRMVSGAQPKVALLYSVTSTYWSPDYMTSLGSAYAALNFIGQPITFMSEKQLAERRRTPVTEDVRVLILPRATHLSDATVAGLVEFARQGGTIVPMGEDNMAFDEYGRTRILPAELKAGRLTSAQPWPSGQVTKPGRELSAGLERVLAGLGLAQPRLIEAGDASVPAQAAWGVEYRVVRDRADRVLVQMTNFLPASRTVSIAPPGCEGMKAVDLLTGEAIDPARIPLRALEPRMLEFVRQ